MHVKITLFFVSDDCFTPLPNFTASATESSIAPVPRFGHMRTNSNNYSSSSNESSKEIYLPSEAAISDSATAVCCR